MSVHAVSLLYSLSLCIVSDVHACVLRCMRMYEETPKKHTNKNDTLFRKLKNRMTSHYRNNPQMRNAHNPRSDAVQIEFMILQTQLQNLLERSTSYHIYTEQ